MKEFDVTITETLKLTVSVEASSKEEAQQMVSDQWHAGDHILDADNFVEVEFESNDGKEISAERAQNDTIEVLMVEPGQYPRVERIGSDLASLQKAVDGYIEAVYPYDDPVALICGEEAKLEGKPLNRALRDGDGGSVTILWPANSSSAVWGMRTLRLSRRSCNRNTRKSSVSRKPF